MFESDEANLKTRNAVKQLIPCLKWLVQTVIVNFIGSFN